MDYDLLFRQVEEVKILLGPNATAASEDEIFQFLEEAADFPDRVKIATQRISSKSTCQNETTNIDLTLSPSIRLSNRETTERSIDLTQMPNTPTAESFKSGQSVVDQFQSHELSFTGTSDSNSCTSGTIHQGTEVSDKECLKRKLPETFQEAGNSSKRSKYDGNEASELDLLTAKIDLDTLCGVSSEYDEAALEKLQNVFPNTDPDFIKENMKDKGARMTDEDVNDLIFKLLEKTDHPTLKDYSDREAKRLEISRIASMIPLDFIEEYEDPHSHFCDPKSGIITDVYKENAFYHLRHHFPTHYSQDVKKAFDTCGHNLIKTARLLEGIQPGKGKQPLEPLPEPPKDLDSVALLELVYYKLAENIIQRQREMKNSRRVKLDTARLLEEVVECEKCHNDSLFQEVCSCPEGHLLCKSCIVAIARKEPSTADVTCPGRWPGSGCGASFPLPALKPLLPNRLFKQMESQRQPMCPFCNCALVLTEKVGLGQCLSCEQISCVLCGETDHSPLKCGEVGVKCQLNSSYSGSSDINIVVDTCVLLDNLPVVKQIASNRLKGGQVPLIWIPWIVLQELDHIKDRRKDHGNLQFKARAAGKWIHSGLLQQNTNNSVRGQSTEEERLAADKFTAQCPDDKILQFCLYLRDGESKPVLSLGRKVLLLTNDINLSSKALIHGISTAKHSSIHKSLTEFAQRKENM